MLRASGKHAMDRSKRVFAALTASALLLLVSLTVIGSNDPANLSVAQVGNVILPAAPTNNFDQFVIVLMENHDLSDIYGPAPYMTQLADQYAFSQHWASITNPSQPNYIALIGGSTFGVSGDGNHPNLNHPTIVDIIENSGHTWNAIAEGSGSGCSINPDRGEDHFPFLSYTTITGSPARCANLHYGAPTDVVAALNAGTNFIWFTPNDGHNMHDNSVASGDVWIQSWVPGLLTAMGTKKAALILMFDEAYTSPPYIYMSFSGPATKLAYNSTASYSHYSLAKLLEDVWGGGSLGQGDVNAPSPLEFFNAGGPPPPLSVDFSYAPAQPAITQTVTFTATPNSGTGPYTFAWNFGDGATGNGNPATHVYTTQNTYTVGVTTTDSAGASAVKSKPVVVLAAPPPGPVATSLTLTTSPNPSQAETSVTVSGRLTGSGAGIPNQAVALEWSWDQGSWSNESQIGQFPPTDADGAFSGTMVFHGIADHTEYIRAQFAATANYLASTSPVVAQAIQLAPAPPPPPPSFSVDFTVAPSSPVVGQIVTFTATTVGGTAPYTSSWTFGDGTTAAGSAATHAYARASTYTVQVTASDSASHTATKSKSVVVTASAPPPPPGGPVAQFAFTPTSPQVDAMVTFDASASTSSNGVLEARWDWEEDGVWDTAWSTTLSASHAFSATGTYSIRLEVRDAGGLSDFIARSMIVIGPQGGGTPGAPTSFDLLGPLEGNPLTLPALGLVFLLFGVAAIRRRLVRTERVRGRHPQAEVEVAGQNDA